MKNYASLILSLALIFGSCSDQEEPTPITMDNLIDPKEGVDAPSNPSAAIAGTFTSFAHGLVGTAVLYTDTNGMRTLRFENFTMTEGPDVYVLFSTTNNYSRANTVAISRLKGAYTSTSLNFEVDDAIDLSTHKFVLVYCVQYSALFGYSELK